jgi:hypothetical protein
MKNLIKYSFMCYFYVGMALSFAQQIKWEAIQSLPAPSENVEKLRYSAQGNYLGALAKNKILLLYDLEGQPIRQYTAPIETVWADFAFSPDEKILAVALGRQDSTFLQLYDIQTGVWKETIFLFPAPLSMLEWHTDTQVLLCVSEAREIQVWQIIDNTLKRAHQKIWDKKDLDEAWVLSANANGRLWAIGGIGTQLLMYEWKKQDLNLRQTFKIDTPIFGLAYHPTEPTLFVSTAHCIKSYQYQKKDWIKTDSLPTQAPIASQLTVLKGNKGFVSVQENKMMYHGRQENGKYQTQMMWQNPAYILTHAPHPRFSHWAVATTDGKIHLFLVEF